jgi:hypothetical protein
MKTIITKNEKIKNIITKNKQSNFSFFDVSKLRKLYQTIDAPTIPTLFQSNMEGKNVMRELWFKSKRKKPGNWKKAEIYLFNL